MVRAWYRADSGDDDTPMRPNPPVFVSVEELMTRTGILCCRFDADSWETDKEYAALKKNRGYISEDTCEISREALPNYDIVVNNFATEHLHPDEEIRFVLEGTGYFDIRDWDDRWIRVEAGKDDLLVLPAGIYHRFVLSKQKYMKVKRLFADSISWTAYFRPDGDNRPERLEYLKRMAGVRERERVAIPSNNVEAN